MKKLTLLLLAQLLVSSVALSKESRIEQLYTALQATDESILERGESYDFLRFNAAFDNELATQTLATSTRADVEAIFHAAEFAAFRTFDVRFVARMRAALEELRRRSLAREAHYSRMASIYVGARDMAAASEMNRHLSYSRRVAVPDIVDESETGTGPSILTLARSGDAWSLVRSRPDFAGSKTVILASPACAFSRRFFDEVKHNDELGRYVSGSLVIMPQVTGLLLDEVDAWNMANRSYRMNYIYARTEWAAVDYWGTPTFYFLEDGKVKEKIIGWQPDVTLPKLLEAYRNAAR